SSRRRHTRFSRDWSSDVCSSDLGLAVLALSSTSVLALEAAVAPAPVAATAAPARTLTTPLAAFGHEVGADYHLITYTQFERYLQIGRASCRERVTITVHGGRSKD